MINKILSPDYDLYSNTVIPSIFIEYIITNGVLCFLENLFNFNILKGLYT